MALTLDGTAGITFNNATTQASAGQILQVVNASSTTETSNATTTYADTTLTASITPKFSTSKILVLVNHSQCYKSADNTANGINMILLRNGSQVALVGDLLLWTSSAVRNTGSVSTSYLDSPATTSSTTYKTQFKNNVASSQTYVQFDSSISTITLMEIAQ